MCPNFPLLFFQSWTPRLVDFYDNNNEFEEDFKTSQSSDIMFKFQQKYQMIVSMLCLHLDEITGCSFWWRIENSWRWGRIWNQTNFDALMMRRWEVFLNFDKCQYFSITSRPIVWNKWFKDTSFILLIVPLSWLINFWMNIYFVRSYLWLVFKSMLCSWVKLSQQISIAALSQSVFKKLFSGILTSSQQCLIAENKGGLLPDFMHMQYC